jgi:hypothetical protein
MYFLGHSNNESWLSQVGSTILIHVGPQARAAVQEHYRKLRQEPQVESVNLSPKALGDFWIVQVLPMPDATATAEVAALCELASEADNPVPVKDSLLKDVLLLTDEYDEIQVSQLTLFQQGSVELSVYLADVLDGRSFLVDGQLDLLEARPAKAAAAA